MKYSILVHRKSFNQKAEEDAKKEADYAAAFLSKTCAAAAAAAVQVSSSSQSKRYKVFSHLLSDYTRTF
jgi:hypothetical protein